MKKLLLTVTLSGLAIFSAAGQAKDQPLPAAPTRPSQAYLPHFSPAALSPERLEMMANFQLTTISRVLGVSFHVDGIIPRTWRTDNPLQMLNPLAPAKYGSGIDNLSVDPLTHRANGIVFLSIRF